ncbi:hypothetical protein [Robiginitomaculum antarcticum]|uniref:hypothetical protein n=1 Tax=Robiginitomaculum antarcticum TaxID=437507 RepID=UPI00037AA885|nr:hypothetical protein [Robiginitomaculum antarcticum]
MIFVRRILNLILAPAMWICSSLSFIGIGRTIQEQSDYTDTLLVPSGIAFSIWFPIFVGCISYGIIQMLPKYRDKEIYRDTGWLTVGGFGFVALWGLVASIPQPEVSKWLTAFVFVPAVLFLCRAAVIFTRRKAELSQIEGYLCWMPVSAIAGWCSLAIWLNWASLGTYSPVGLGLPALIIALLCLAAALGWVVFNLRLMHGNAAYAVPVIWGLGWLVVARLQPESSSLPIVATAGIGALVLMVTTIILQRQRPASEVL